MSKGLIRILGAKVKGINVETSTMIKTTINMGTMIEIGVKIETTNGKREMATRVREVKESQVSHG